MEKIGLAAILDMTNFSRGTAEYMGATSKMESANVSLSRQFDKAGDTMMATGAKMTLGITTPLTLMAGKAVDAASDMSESMNKVQVVFGGASDSILQWSSTASTSLGQSQQQALEAAGTFGNLLTSLGMTDDRAAGMSMSIVTLASDLASFNNIDPTIALEKLRAGLVGEAEPLRALGVNLTAAGVEAEAMRLGLIKAGDELTGQAAVQARYSLILQQTTNAQGDFARTSDGLANSQRILKAEMADAAAELGKALLPVMQDVVGVVREAVQWFSDLPEPAKKMGLALGGIAAAAGPLTTGIGAATKALGLMFANPVLAGIALLAAGVIALVTHLQNVKAEAQKTAAEILTASKSYSEYVREAEDAGVASEIVSEALYRIYKNAIDAGRAIDQLEFQKAADELEDFLAQASVINLSDLTTQYTDAAVAQQQYTYLVSAGVSALSQMQVEMLSDEDTVRSWGIEMGKTGNELDLWTAALVSAGDEQIQYRARVEDTSQAVFDEKEKMREARRETDNIKVSYAGVTGTLLDFDNRMKEAAKSTAGATTALETQRTTAELMSAALQSAGQAMGSSIDTLADKWDELTEAERRAAELAIAQTLMEQARTMLADGTITLGQYADLWGAMRDEFGSLVDPAQVTTDKLTAMLGQWAMQSGVTAQEFANAIGNMGLTMDTATADAQAAEAAFIASFANAGRSATDLSISIGTTLGSAITGLPVPVPIAFGTTGFDMTMLQLLEMTTAAANLPESKNISVDVRLTGSPDILPMSPHTMMEIALENLSKTAEKVAALTVTITASAEIIKEIENTLLAIIEILKVPMPKALASYTDAYKAATATWEEKTRLFRDQLVDLYQVHWPTLTDTVIAGSSAIDAVLSTLSMSTLPTLKSSFVDTFGEVGTLISTASVAVATFGTAISDVGTGPLAGLRDAFRDAFGGADGITPMVSEAAVAIRGMATDLYGARDAANALGPAFTTFENAALPAIDQVRIALTSNTGLNPAIGATEDAALSAGNTWNDSWQAVLDTIYAMNVALDGTINRLNQIGNGALIASYALDLALHGGGTMAAPMGMIGAAPARSRVPATLTPATLSAGGGGSSRPAVAVNIGPVTIANGTDMAEFESRVMNAVSNGLRIGR